MSSQIRDAVQEGGPPKGLQKELGKRAFGAPTWQFAVSQHSVLLLCVANSLIDLFFVKGERNLPCRGSW